MTVSHVTSMSIPTSVRDGDADYPVIAAALLPADPADSASPAGRRHLVAFDRSAGLLADGVDASRPFAVAELAQDDDDEPLLSVGVEDLAHEECLQVFADALNSALARSTSATP